jgi:hypothetical protein
LEKASDVLWSGVSHVSLPLLLSRPSVVRGLDKGEELVFAGCSAGAMIAYLQVDYWAASGLIPPSVRKVGVMASAVGRRSGGGTCRGRLVFPMLWRKKSLLR